MQIPNPAGGYFSATMAAIPKGHKVVTDRKRMTPRTVGWKGAFVRCRPKARRDDWQGSDPNAGLNNKSVASSVTQNFRFARRAFLSFGYFG
jgi:hypothetical protein